MRVVCIGDIHGRASWKLIAHNEKWDKLVFVGDYFDAHDDISGIVQLNNFEQIIQFKKQTEKPVVLLIGNHDLHYFPEIGYNGTSGYQAGMATSFSYALNENREHLDMAHAHDNILFTHAGVGEAWMENIVKHGIVNELPKYTPEGIAEWVNDMWKYKPGVFNFTGRDSHGDDMGQTPVWIRPRSLMKDSQVLKKQGIIQIVGHTQQSSIDIKGKSTGSKYFFIDTLGTSKEYLIYENNIFSLGKV